MQSDSVAVKRVLVTGATGLIGSNVCERLVSCGHEVVALVRPGSDTTALNTLGVSVSWGDLSDAASVSQALEGCHGCVHTAAIVPSGGATTAAEYHEVNLVGTRHVLDGAGAERRVVVLNTSGAFDRTGTVHEGSALASGELNDPYADSKRDVHRDVLRRLGEGADIVTVLPAATIGRAPTVRRAVMPPGFNSRMLMAIRGEISEFPQMPLSVVLASDVAEACVAALESGVAGRVYLPWGRVDEIIGACELLNLACEAAGVSAKVTPVEGADLHRPEVAAKWGPSIVRSATIYPDPYFTNHQTVAELRYEPVPVREAVHQTVDWMLAHELV